MATSNNKTPWIIVGLLAVMNLGLLAFLWVNAPGNRGPEGPKSGKDILIERLEMDASQQALFEVEYERHHERIRDLQVEMRRKKDALFSFEGEVEVEDLANEIGALQVEIDLATRRHFEKVRSFLEPAQREEFQEVFQEIFGPRRGGKHGPPPPRP